MATDVYFGINLELAGTAIALEPKTAINKIKTEGLECGLPAGKSVSLGTVGAGLQGILEALGADKSGIIPILVEKKDTNGAVTSVEINGDLLPNIDALKKSLSLLTNAQLTLEEFHVKIPPSLRGATGNDPAPAPAPAPATTLYTVGISATWGERGELLSDTLKLKLRGIFLRVSNEPTLPLTTR